MQKIWCGHLSFHLEYDEKNEDYIKLSDELALTKKEMTDKIREISIPS